jgi:hypothetical protein
VNDSALYQGFTKVVFAFFLFHPDSKGILLEYNHRMYRILKHPPIGQINPQKKEWKLLSKKIHEQVIDKMKKLICP